VLDYHLHLWPHHEHDTPLRVEQLAQYCERAQEVGVTELALTEHLFRFRQAEALLGGFWDDEAVAPSLRESMAEYWRFHATVDLDAYVVAGLLSGYPFDVLLGSVHWVDAWRFDDVDDAVSMAEWSVRDVDASWDAYTAAIEELAASGACDVLAHPDLIKAAGHLPRAPAEWWDRIAEAAAASGMAAELSSSGWRKPVGEQYPARGLLERLVARGVPLTTASDAHHLDHVSYRADDLRGVLGAVGVHTLQAYAARRPHTVEVSGSPAAGAPPAAPGAAGRG
jgi:histidinol-phosphatase (PHP family)